MHSYKTKKLNITFKDEWKILSYYLKRSELVIVEWTLKKKYVLIDKADFNSIQMYMLYARLISQTNSCCYLDLQRLGNTDYYSRCYFS